MIRLTGWNISRPTVIYSNEYAEVDNHGSRIYSGTTRTNAGEAGTTPKLPEEFVPHATEELRWGKPAFADNGILFIYAAYKNHLSLHPTPHVIQALHHEMSEYISSENTIRFSLDCPIPEAIVIKISNLRVIHKEKGIGWK